MEPRPLGRSSVRVSPIILGTMAHGAQSPAQRTAVIDAAIEAGITSMDTAPLYEFGKSESILGRAIRSKRDRVQLLSKVGLRWDDGHGEVLFWFEDDWGQRRAVRRDSRPDAIRKDLEESLRRLGVDHLDLVQVHHPDLQTPIEDAMAALARLQEQGKVRAIGVSNYTAAQIRQAQRCLGSVCLASDQLEYNLVKRHAERDLLPLLAQLEISALIYSPLEAGLLAGRHRHGQRIRDGRTGRAFFHPTNLLHIDAAIDTALLPIAERHRASVGQIALAWLLAQPAVTSVIVGASSVTQVHENAGAASIQLSSEEMRRIGDAFANLPLNAHPSDSPARRALRLGRRAVGKARRMVMSALVKES